MNTHKIYFRGLNELRAIAAISVIFYHARFYSTSLGIGEISFLKMGNAGVTLFFVLSGFLITYLLLDEKEISKEISIKNFYFRRILRIWPLYFLYIAIVVLLAITGVITLQHSFPPLLFYLFFLGNIPFWLQRSGYPLLGHYWSLGVEEQFYAFWPWIIRKSRNIPRTIFIFWIVLVTLKIIARVIGILQKDANSLFYSFMNAFSFQTMAIGGLAACALFYRKETILKIVYYPVVQVAAWLVLLLTALNLINHLFPSVIFHEVFGGSTAIIILNTVSNPKPLFWIHNKVLDFLGRISYGLYVYHSLVMYILFTYFSSFFHYQQVVNYIVAHLAILLLTTGISWLSYEFFEKRFLLIKEKYK